jgi:hypothetical protein
MRQIANFIKIDSFIISYTSYCNELIIKKGTSHYNQYHIVGEL